MTQEKLLAEELQSLGETGYTPLMEAVRQQDRESSGAYATGRR